MKFMTKFNAELDELLRLTASLDWDGAGALPVSPASTRLVRNLVAALGRVPDGLFPYSSSPASGFTLEYGEEENKSPLVVFHITDKIEMELFDKYQKTLRPIYSTMDKKVLNEETKC
jgi:hypothetical protein